MWISVPSLFDPCWDEICSLKTHSQFMRFFVRSLTVIILCIAFGSAHAASETNVSRAVASKWPDQWCQAEPKMKREQLIAIMGPPTDTSPTTMSWSAYQYRFYAFLAPDGTIKQLDINTYSLSDAEKAALKCKTARTKPSTEIKQVAHTAHTTVPACGLITAEEMSGILGKRMVATPEDRSDQETKCTYHAATAMTPSIEFTVSWGDGRAGMRGMGMAESHEPGLTTPYDGIGDQAASAGPMLMIRTGEDLITIVFTGVNDAPAVAKQMFTTAKARL